MGGVHPALSSRVAAGRLFSGSVDWELGRRKHRLRGFREAQ